MNEELLKTAYYYALMDGSTLENKRVLIYCHKGIVKRWQVYSERTNKKFDGVFSEIEVAIDKFVELTR